MRTFGSSVYALGACALAACAPQADDGATEQAAASDWQHPVTEWGEPDLRGMWPIGHLTGVPLQRPAAFGERRFLTD